jgi:two-component system, LuxR family, sensor kinase FixL
VFILITASVWFVHVFFGTGRFWLAVTVTLMYALLLVVNFTSATSMNYLEITGLRWIELWEGATVPVAEATVSPWNRAEGLVLVLWCVFIADGTRSLWRRGGRDNRRRAWLVGGSLTFLTAIGALGSQLVHEGILALPYLMAWLVLGPLFAMGYELGSDVLRAKQLAQQVHASEVQLRESEERVRLALAGAQLALWDWNIANNTVYLSDRWKEIIGGAPQSVTTTFTELAGLVHPDDLPGLRRHLGEVLKGEVPAYEVEHRVRALSGDWLWIHSRGEVVARDGAGWALRMTGVNEDITARKRMDEQLRESEERMALATNAAGIGMWAWDVQNGQVWVSKRGRNLFGWTETEPVDFARFLAAVHPDDRVPMGRTVQRSLDGEGEYEIEFRAVLPDASSRWISARGQIEFNGKGGATRMRGVALDITERRRIEADIAQQRNELAHLSRVAMLGELSGSLAHELNQPLAAILSNAQAAQRFLAHGTEDVDELREILKDIVEDYRRAGEVIRRLRVLLRKEEVEHHPLDINEVVLDVLRLMRSDLLNRNVTVNTDLAAGLPQVTGDRIQLQQVLLNLVINACDAMNSNAARDRRLDVSTAMANHGFVEVSVCDRGRGIPAVDLDRIFEPFVTTKAHGMGLGLAVCRTIVNAHAGRIWGTNNTDRGARFCLTLPVNGAAMP